MWPDKILANNLTDKLIGRIKYEINSINMTKGAKCKSKRPGKYNNTQFSELAIMDLKLLTIKIQNEK